MINSRLLTLFAALVASAPADCYVATFIRTLPMAVTCSSLPFPTRIFFLGLGSVTTQRSDMHGVQCFVAPQSTIQSLRST